MSAEMAGSGGASPDTDEAAPPWVDAPPGHWARRSKPGLVLAGHALIYALTTPDAWEKAALIWEHHMSQEERARLLAHAIRVCEPEDAMEIMEAAVSDLAVGQPGARRGPLRMDAERWVAWATQAEVKAYLLACFHKLDAGEQVRFLRALQKRVLR